MAATRSGRSIRIWIVTAGMLSACASHAVVLPEDRADLMYHYYDGGGVTVSGPAMLVRKNAGDNVSMSGHYYMDMVSGASIDVITTASPYKDVRNEYGFGMDYLYGNSMMSFGVTNSVENDYRSDTYTLGVSHDLFGGLTTLNLGYGQGHDTIMRVNETFEATADHYNFRMGVTQILSRTSLLGFAFEDVSDNGYLSNPYRIAWVRNGAAAEKYPRARDSQAIATRYIYGFSSDNLPVQRSLRLEYRYYQDTWGIRAHTAMAALQRQVNPKWIWEFHWRYYTQDAASFYSDNFPEAMTYMARDKELSTFHSHSLGGRVSWKYADRRFWFFNQASLNLAYDYILFDYKDFTDVRTGEPYSFNANVVQLFISGWY